MATYATEKSLPTNASARQPNAKSDQQELGARGGSRDGDPARIAARRADERQHALHRGDAEREDQREMAELGGHGFTVFCAFAACSSACAASGGM